jgi:aryl-alcohol dehydrogenase-like predicted oxidoreductase
MFGTWAIGGGMWGPTDDDQAIAAMRRAFELGVTAFDTADAYGWGHAEELVGKAFRDRRDKVFIATKLGITRKGISLAPDYLPKACEASLKRLASDYIDLYQIHWPDDPNTPLEDAWESMSRLRDQGKVRSIGVSNFDSAQLDLCEKIRHVDSVQNEYSMFVRDAEDAVIPWCEANGTGFLSYGSLAYGLLAGKFTGQTTFPKSDWRSGSMGMDYYEQLFKPHAFKRNLKRVERLREIASGLNITVGQLAIAWILRHETVTSAIVGARRPEQIEENASAGDITLDGRTIEAIETALAA